MAILKDLKLGEMVTWDHEFVTRDLPDLFESGRENGPFKVVGLTLLPISWGGLVSGTKPVEEDYTVTIHVLNMGRMEFPGTFFKRAELGLQGGVKKDSDCPVCHGRCVGADA